MFMSVICSKASDRIRVPVDNSSFELLFPNEPLKPISILNIRMKNWESSHIRLLKGTSSGNFEFVVESYCYY